MLNIFQTKRITLPGVEGAFVDETTPFAARGPWLQVLVTEELAHTFIRDLDEISTLESVSCDF